MASPNRKSDLSIRKSLTTTAYEQLEELIVTAELEPGAILSEATLVEQLGIGRTPIREALQKLEREGLIRIMPRKGIEVTDLNPAKQLLMLELRRDLEKLLARSGALRATEEERTAFIVIADAMAETAAAGKYRFHTTGLRTQPTNGASSSQRIREPGHWPDPRTCQTILVRSFRDHRQYAFVFQPTRQPCP